MHAASWGVDAVRRSVVMSADCAARAWDFASGAAPAVPATRPATTAAEAAAVTRVRRMENLREIAGGSQGRAGPAVIPVPYVTRLRLPSTMGVGDSRTRDVVPTPPSGSAQP